ncbi:sulfurtransferase TusA family protein [Brytella acorum]|uniref:Sulfurtransferase TusA family protein n=1 Tax=Brytella acorum TaxID=2959299 RepID=A0AA35UZ69_9PROT|nr:sulfurtransferase TusA family protein [Brytella acorum]MDF3624992.1 sulfurtransferase TusA family protein [Brytella acorum]CAI9122177.1 sulfurtransferase TusA family protein [Brytella acorum]
MTGAIATDTELDITGEVCPMTTVHVRLALDRLPGGAILGVTLTGDEPHHNVASAVRALGHQIVLDETLSRASDLYRLVIRKSQARTSASPPSA